VSTVVWPAHGSGGLSPAASPNGEREGFDGNACLGHVRAQCRTWASQSGTGPSSGGACEVGQI
jgi:hypothetical protein